MYERPPSINDAYDAKQLAWLISLRWSALIGLVFLVVSAQFLLTFTLPLEKLWLLLLGTAFSNVLLQGSSFIRPFAFRNVIVGALIFDIVVLTLFLYLSGGPSNPFSIIYLVHVSIAAILAGPKWTWIVVFLSTLGFGLLFQFHVVVPQLEMNHGHDHGFSIHLAGMLIAFSLVAVLLGYFLSRMSETLIGQEREIYELTLLSSQHEKLASLTTLAAGAAHELGSPLGAISIAASELERQLSTGLITNEALEDTRFIATELRRCREILDKMSGQAGDLAGEMPSIITGSEIQNEIASNLGTLSTRVDMTFDPDVVVRVPRKNLIEVLCSLIRNALDASSDTPVTVRVENHKNVSSFIIQDRGTGMPQEIASRIGEPFFTTKEPGKGMGLGVFLAKLFAKSIGGNIEYRTKPLAGTTVTFSVPIV